MKVRGSWCLSCKPTRRYDVAPDGQSFYAAAFLERRMETPGATHVNLVLNWAEELKARAPAAKELTGTAASPRR